VLLELTTGRLLVIAAVTLVVLLLLRRRIYRVDPQALMVQRLAHDGEDLYKRWVQNAFLVVTGNCDFAHLPRVEAIRMLSAWWEVHGPSEHARMLTALEDAGRPDNAWDLLRFVLLARLGVAAGYLDDLSAWARIRPIAARLQRAYPDWSAMAQAYLLARRQARGLAADGTEDDASTQAIRDNVAHLHGTRWREMPYRLHLEGA
jgi:hypothetical protein